MEPEYNLFGEVVRRRAPKAAVAADFYLMDPSRGSGAMDIPKCAGSAMADEVQFGEWLHHRPASALQAEIGLRAAMCAGKPFTHHGSDMLFRVNFKSEVDEDQRNTIKLFEMDGLPEGWRAAVGKQLLKSKDVDAMAKLRIAAKMAEAKA